MKKAFLSLALLPIFLHADGEFAMEDTKKTTKQEQSVIPSYYEYHNRMAVFGPFHQVYERIKNDAFYVGVETWLVLGGITGSHKATALLEAELRMGYNLFYRGRCHVTPFAGVGVIKSTKRHHYNTDFETTSWGHIEHKKFASLPGVAYGVIGVLYDHEFNSVVNLGLRVKGMIGGGSEKDHINWGNPVVGVDVAVPLTFRFGYKRHWDFRLEPFDIYLRGSNVDVNYYGLRNTIGYRF